jgi:transposase
LAAHPRLEILPLPVAAPDLNPQEHVWKATRQAVSHNHGQRDLIKLADRFEQHLKEIPLPAPYSIPTITLAFVRGLNELSIRKHRMSRCRFATEWRT